MSDPFKDARIRKARQARKSVADRFVPVVLWVKPSHLHNPDCDVTTTATDIASDALADSRLVKTPRNSPRVERVITEFDDPGSDAP